MKEFLIGGSPNGTVIFGEYLQAETEAEARAQWKATHTGWQLEQVTHVKPGHNDLGQLRPGCACGCPCHANEAPGVKSACGECVGP